MAPVAFADKEVPLPPGYTHLGRLIKKFAKNHPRYNTNVFLMMPFEESRHNQAVTRAIKSALAEYGLLGLRVDDREYASTLWDNICIYALGCKYGVAVFERTRSANFNPNVAIELGFALGRNKKVLILKDRRIRSLPSDIVGRLYRQFDPLRLGASIRRQVGAWAKNLGLKKKTSVLAVFKLLSPREEKVLRLLYGIGEKRRHNIREMAAAFALPKNKVVEIRDEAISKLGGRGRVRALLEYLPE